MLAPLTQGAQRRHLPPHPHPPRPPRPTLQRGFRALLKSLTTKKKSIRDCRVFIEKHYGEGRDTALAAALLARRAVDPIVDSAGIELFKRRLSLLYVIDSFLGKHSGQSL